MDPKYSRWISTDPALGEYIPKAPIDEEAKKYNQNLPGMGGVFNHINGNLYHYSTNNPVKYTDPDGETAKNATDQYVVVRLESDNEPCHYMILAPGDFITADCDGAIFSSSNMIKLSAQEDWGDVVNFTILGECSLGAFCYISDLKSVWINTSRDYFKYLYNVSRLAKNLIHSFTDEKYESFKDFSGSYRKQSRDGQPLNSWWKGVIKEFDGATQEKLKEIYETNGVQQELQQKYLKTEENK